jgi:hypothetical protein
MMTRASGRWAAGLLAGGIVLLGCDLLRIEVSEEAETQVDGAGVLGGLLQTLDLGGLDDFDLAIEQSLADQGVEPGDLRSVEILTFTLTADPDLGFLSSMEVWVAAEGIAEFRVASIGDVARGETTAELALDPVDLAEAVQAGGMRFRVDVSGDLPEDDTVVTAAIVAEVVATPRGACNAASGE